MTVKRHVPLDAHSTNPERDPSDHSQSAYMDRRKSSAQEVEDTPVMHSELAASNGAALVGFVQAGDGSVPRVALDKLRERVSAEDFGASSSASAAANSAALSAALAAAQGVVISSPLEVDPQTFPTGNGKTLWFEGNGRFDTRFGQLTAIRVRSAGSFTEKPTLTVTATGSGSGAVISALMGARQATPAIAGSGYGFRDVLTLVGGTYTRAAKLIVSGRDANGAITSAFVSDPGEYSQLPSGNLAVTGGSGSGANVTLNWQLVGAHVTAAGGGYDTAPNITVEGAGVLLAPVIDAVGMELAFAGEIIAANQQIFGIYGAVKSALANDEIRPEWFGAKGDTPSGTALQKALDASAGKMLRLGAKRYWTDRTLTPPATCTIAGVNRTASTIVVKANVHVFTVRAGFDLYMRDFGIADPDNLMSLGASAVHFSPTTNSIQRVYFADMLIDVHGRGFSTESYECSEVFGCEWDRVNIYSTGAAMEMFYTTGLKLRHVLGEHIGRPQDSLVLRDFWFYGCTAMLGGGLVLSDVTSRVPHGSGIVVEGVGGHHAYPRFLQAWLYQCSADNCGYYGVDASGVDQFVIDGGYYALCGNIGNGACVRIVNASNYSILNAQLHDGKDANLTILDATRGQITSNRILRESVFAAAPCILIQAPSNIVGIVGNAIHGGSKGVRAVGAVNLMLLTSNDLTYNGAGPTDAVDASAVTNSTISNNLI